MEKFRIAICDDDNKVLDYLEALIGDFGRKEGLEFDVERFDSGEHLCEYMNDDYFPGLVFLDIQMKKIDGVQVGQFIRERKENYTTQIVYMTSHDQYVKQLFDVNPIGFMDKPLNEESVEKYLVKAMKLNNISSGVFYYKRKKSILRMPISEILYFEGKDREVIMHTKSGVDRFYDSLERIYEELQKFDFFYTHKSYLVSYYRVVRFAYKELEMEGGEIVTISERRRKEVQKIRLDIEMRRELRR